MNAVLIYNPTARRIRGNVEKINLVYHLLFKNGIDAEPVATTKAGDATDMARRAVEQKKELIVVYGGDGTINEVVCGMAETSIPLAIIPGGTANVLARELGISWDVKAAIRVVANGEPKRITLGLGDGRYFHSMAGIGIDASIVKGVDPYLKDALGVGAFWVEGLRHFFYDLPTFRILVDGKDYVSTFAVLGNTRSYGGRFVITPLANITEEVFDVCIFTTQSKLRYSMYLPLAFFGTHLRFPDVIYLKAQRVYAECEKPIYVQMDGELVGQLPMQFRTVPNALTVIVPKR